MKTNELCALSQIIRTIKKKQNQKNKSVNLSVFAVLVHSPFHNKQPIAIDPIG